MSRSIWREFDGVLPKRPLTIAEVVSHNSDGTSTVEYPGGAQVRVRGQSVDVGDNAFIRDGEIRGQAPDVTPDVLDV
jgi:hypothetical protein